MHVLVKAACQLKTVKIVSFDWLEDSLIKMYPRNEREYLMGYEVLHSISRSLSDFDSALLYESKQSI